MNTLWALTWVGFLSASPVRLLGPAPREKVERVVTLAPSITEMVVAMKATQLLVGVTRFDELKEVEKLPRVGGFVDPSVEAIVALKPHLVLVQPSPGNQKPVEALAKLKIPILVLPLDTVDSVLTSMREVGKALGKAPEAEALVKNFEDTRRRIQRASAALPKKRVLFAYDFQPLVVAGPGSFAHELLLDAGAINVCDVPSAYAVFPLEKALASAPEVVIDASNASNNVTQLKALLASKKTVFLKLPSKNLMHPGPGLIDGLKELFLLLHPTEPLP